jgi:hypothetical protein
MPEIGFISGISFIITGVYSMIYGIADLADLYTRAIAIVCLGLGFIIMFMSAYSFLEDGGGDN